MTQHIRANKSYPAVSAVNATPASSANEDLARVHQAICAKVGVPKGTTQYGTVKAQTVSSVSTLAMLINDTYWSTIITAGYDPVGSGGPGTLAYSNLAAEATESNTSIVPAFPNPGLHAQIILNFGDSLEESTTGSTAYPDLAVRANQAWTFGCDSYGGPCTVISATGGGNNPDRIQTDVWCDPRSRIIIDFAHGGWRFENQELFSYLNRAGSPWNKNILQASGIVVHPSQQIIAWVEQGSNDIAYGDLNSNPGIGSVPKNTPGYTYNTYDLDFWTHCFIPFITALKALYPNIKIIWQAPIARDAGTNSASISMNGRFVEMIAYAKANRVSLGIDVIIDTTQIAEYNPANWSAVVNNPLVYQPIDKTHLVKDGYAVKRPIKNVAYDYLAGFPIPTQYASAVIVA